MEALLFGQPIIKARQIQDSPPRRDKGKGRATDDSEDDLTSPDVPLRQIRSTHRPSSRPRQTTVEDLVESDGRASASRPNAHNWKAGQSAQSRSRPIRAPDPHSQSAVEVEDDMQDVGSSPPTGSIFISQLPKNIRKGCKYTRQIERAKRSDFADI